MNIITIIKLTIIVIMIIIIVFIIIIIIIINSLEVIVIIPSKIIFVHYTITEHVLNLQMHT